MTREQREIVNRIAEALLEIIPGQRPAALEALCAGLDPGEDVTAIRAEVERLLEEDEALPARLTQVTKPLGSPTGGPLHAAAPVPTAHVPAIVGRYHIRSLLGQGGMGQVYLAEQRSPIRRLVAVKLIASGLESYEIMSRFEAERQALARMDHPGIARALDAGLTDGGRPYFVMEYVDGKPITTFADEQKLSLRARLELFVQVCDAIAHAHTKGIIHRDLKPSNVLAFIDEAGNAAVKVIDFGIAKAVTSDLGTRVSTKTQLTSAGVTVGTYEYMSPEQAAMSSDIDTRTDVYSLGVMLYELLAGVRPFELKKDEPNATDELRRAVREEDPPRPSSRIRALRRSVIAGSDFDQLIHTLRSELEWIPMMALRKQRDRRYAGAAEMAIDVRNYLEDRPLIAAPESRRYLARKFISRHRAGLLVAGLTLLLLVAGIVGTTIGMIRADAARTRADENERRATQSAYRSAIVAAEVALRNGDSIRLRQALATAPAALRGWEWHYFTNLGDTFSVTLQRESGDRFAVTHVLPDGRRAVSATNTLAGSAVLWDLATGQILRREKGGIVAMDHAGRSMALLGPDGSLRLIDVATGTPRWTAPPPRADRPWALLGICFAPGDETLVAWDGSNEAMTFFDVASGTQRALRTGVPMEYPLGYIFFDNEPPRVAFVPVGSVGFHTLDPATGVTARERRVDYLFRGVPFRGVGPHLWSPTDRADGAPVFFCDYFVSANTAVYLPASRRLALGREDGSVDLIRAEGDAAPNRMTQKLVAGSERVHHLAAMPGESQLVVTLATGEVGVLHVEPAPQVRVPLHGVFAAAVSPDRSKIIGGAWGEVQCVDTVTGLPLWGRNLGPANNQFLAWSPDGSRVVVVTGAIEDGQSDVFVLDGATGDQLAAWSDSPVTHDPTRAGQTLTWARSVAGIGFHPSGGSLYVAHTDGAVSRVDATTWDTIETINETWEPATTLDGEFFADLKSSPDGRALAQIIAINAARRTGLGALMLRDAQTGKLLRRLAMPGLGATACAWSPDSAFLAASFTNATQTRVVLIDARTGRTIFDQPLDSLAPVRSMTFTSDGQRLVVFTQAGRAQLLERETGQLVSSPFTTDAVNYADYGVDGALLISGGGVLLQRAESQMPARFPDGYFSHWPTGVPRPLTVDDARRKIARAQNALKQAYGSEKPIDAYIAALASNDPSTAALVRALHARFPPSINMLNSESLRVLISPDSTPVDLSRAREMLSKAVAIKPQSGNLQANLGTVLFVQRNYADCVAPLETSERLRAQRGVPPSATTLLRLAIATRALNDPRTRDYYVRAKDAIAQQMLDADPEVVALRSMLDKMGSPE